MNNKIMINKYKRERTIGTKSWSNKRYHNLKINATRRRSRPIPFSLTLEDARVLYEEEHCYYCGEVAEIRTIDRVDNSQGYTKENCVMACQPCNLLKGKLLKSDTERMTKILNKL